MAGTSFRSFEVPVSVVLCAHATGGPRWMHEEEELSAEARRVETGAATAYRADRVHLHKDPLQCACRLIELRSALHPMIRFCQRGCRIPVSVHVCASGLEILERPGSI